MPISFPSSYEFQEFHEIGFTDFGLIPVFSRTWPCFQCACLTGNSLGLAVPHNLSLVFLEHAILLKMNFVRARDGSN